MAAHFCPQCSQEVSSTARFCPNCAAPLGSPAPGSNPAATTLAAAAQRTRRLIIPGMVLALAVLALALIIAGRPQPSVLVAAPAPAPLPAPSIVSAPVAPPAPAAPAITNAPVQPPTVAPAVTNAPTRPVPVLPQDVAAYLTFLQGIEQRRLAINTNVDESAVAPFTAQLMQPMMDINPEDSDQPKPSKPAITDEVMKTLADNARKQMLLTRDFSAVPAPEQCALLANSYYGLLGSYSNLTTKLEVAVQDSTPSSAPGGSAAANSAMQGNVSGAIQEAMKAATQAQHDIDDKASKADTTLGDLCNRYGVPKPFSIGSDSAAPSLLGH